MNWKELPGLIALLNKVPINVPDSTSMLHMATCSSAHFEGQHLSGVLQAELTQHRHLQTQVLAFCAPTK